LRKQDFLCSAEFNKAKVHGKPEVFL